ncbi:hypothetical protein DEIPH_ctg025orf0050 [Deinococcus phoenicis]|uniref:Uncharacterized protein n=2 Tax=Deinococcus phoenicis TaxID=1476583 RepID=A0A016QQE7_9DEIO|nr:hypothetical protein DEIPH_ctg025orf0050 [Deinococcus phoenicis]
MGSAPKDELLRERLSGAIAESIPGLQDRLTTDPEVHLELIQYTAQAKAETEALLHSSVTAARNAGHSWEAIGRALGMTRQAAQQRFGRGGPPVEGLGETRRLSPLTSLDEMDILKRAGRYGWHSTGFGTLYHTVQKDTQQWEHRRVVVFDPSRRGLEAEGWQRIGNLWFPWGYYKRPTGRPALAPPHTGYDFFSADADE